mgnify:CR=1 FL=1
MTIKIKQTYNSKGKRGRSVYEIHKGDRHIGWIARLPNDRDTWQVDVETPQGQRFRRSHYLKDAKQMAKELLA